MNASDPLGTCPVDLDYPDPQPPVLDLAAIVGHGRRIRRRRKLTQLGTVLAACVAVGSVIAGARDFTISMFPSQSGPPAAANPAPVDALIAGNPPANGKLTLISSRPRHWTTVAWATRRGEVCWATFRTPMQGGSSQVQCPAWSGPDAPGSEGIAGSLFPDVALAGSSETGSGTVWPVLGLTSPQAVRVVLTAYGRNIGASVVPVPVGAGKTVGVFLAWIRAPGGGFSSSAVTSEIAYDQSGHSITRAANPP